MVLGIVVTGRNRPRSVAGVPAPELGWASAYPGQKPNLKQRKGRGNDTSHLMAKARMWLGKFPQHVY